MFTHVSVFLREALEFLNLKPGSTVVDATVGLGGHSREILKGILPGGSLIAMDQDERTLEVAKENLRDFNDDIRWVHGNFRNLESHLKSLQVSQVDAILMDLGFSSYQLEDVERGFSFSNSGPLDMRMDVSKGCTAREVLRDSSEEELSRIFFDLGEERYARKIARAIVQSRRQLPLQNSFQLADLVEKTIGRRYQNQKIHPATRVFQALRIYVNDEMGALEEVLPQALRALRSGGRWVVISFHSLEDGLVKRFFRGCSVKGGDESGGSGVVKILTRKPLRPSPEEVRENRRARSARLRAIEKI
ncbi:MAG: 16S rRNA (cytosine(1402)-N(4))-methyltransferase RsmH [Chlamydiae bacterium]|nr:16S rRNA (cytosine(1402)-N(4))-methyltransferase RsmH [Chlamydiota bacterium]MBI3267017.1 16S rRNA (cytosine(1402)-N(4))-methyltransferase RsmH [Chlamydiota bacterium]